MLKKTTNGYDDIFNEYLEGYENDWYDIWFVYKADSEHKKIEPSDPTNDKQVKIVAGRKDGVGARILIYNILSSNNPVDPEEEKGNVRCLHFMENDRIYFENLVDSKDDWAEAGQTIVEIDQLVREKFPGYYITNKYVW